MPCSDLCHGFQRSQEHTPVGTAATLAPPCGAPGGRPRARQLAPPPDAAPSPRFLRRLPALRPQAEPALHTQST